jgi:hypothetical protein
MGQQTADTDLVLDAMAYVEAVHVDLTAENTAPAPGVEGRVVSAILADPALSDYVRDWARARGAGGTRRAPRFDAVYERVRELLRRTGDEAGSEPWR